MHYELRYFSFGTKTFHLVALILNFDLVLENFDLGYIYWTKCIRLIDWLFIVLYTSRSRIFHSYEDVTITGEGLHNLGLFSALRAFELGGIFIVPHLLWHGASGLLRHTRGCGGSILSPLRLWYFRYKCIMKRSFFWYQDFWPCDPDLELWPSFEKTLFWAIYFESNVLGLWYLRYKCIMKTTFLAHLGWKVK
jgi:hypothetical protein